MFHPNRFGKLGVLIVGFVAVVLAVGLAATPASAATPSETLVIKVTGLPKGTPEKVAVTRGSAYSKAVSFTSAGTTKTITLTVPEGVYTVTPTGTKLGNTHYYSSAVSTTLAVNKAKTVTVTFSKLVLTFHGLGRLKTGFTVAQVKKVDPTAKVLFSGSSGGCAEVSTSTTGTSTGGVQGLLFNPNGKLAWIAAAPFVTTEKGIGKGSTFAQVKKVYTITSSKITVEDDQPLWIGSNGKQNGPAPQIGLEFDEKGLPVHDYMVDVSHSKVVGIVLNAGQQCFD